MRDRGVNTDDIEQIAGGKTFFWAGRYERDVNVRHTLQTDLNVFETFEPKLSEESAAADVLFLANIVPALQIAVREQCKEARFTALDSMNLWIDIARDDLVRAIGMVDCVIVNDGEIKQLTDEPNLVRAARAVLEMGPRIVIAKQGEYGSTLFTGDEIFALPAYPTPDVVDPTGAGDTFAGGFVGYVAAHGDEDLRAALAYGTALASFNVEAFGTERLADADDATRSRSASRALRGDHALDLDALLDIGGRSALKMTWGFIWLMFVLKIPIFMLFGIVYWAVKQDATSRSRRRRCASYARPHPHRRPPRRRRPRGPHGDPAVLPSPPRVRGARGRLPRVDVHSAISDGTLRRLVDDGRLRSSPTTRAWSSRRRSTCAWATPSGSSPTTASRAIDLREMPPNLTEEVRDRRGRAVRHPPRRVLPRPDARARRAAGRPRRARRGEVEPRPPGADRPRHRRLRRPGLEGHADARAQQPHARPDQALRRPADRAAQRDGAGPRRRAPVRLRGPRLALPGPGGGDRKPLRRVGFRRDDRSVHLFAAEAAGEEHANHTAFYIAGGLLARVGRDRVLRRACAARTTGRPRTARRPASWPSRPCSWSSACATAVITA